jgi:hypothetical protein
MLEWIIAISCWPIIGISAGNYNPYFYCAIQATILLITYSLRKKGILTFGSPFVHYILALIIGHLVYLVKEWIPIVLAISCWPIIGPLEKNPDVLYYYCAIQLILLSITYFLRKKGVLTFGSPLVHYILALIIGHIIYVGSFVWVISHY